MNANKREKKLEPLTAFSFIGNLGCIRFPKEVKKISGVKRENRLVVKLIDEHTIALEKLEIPNWVKTEEMGLPIEGCSCSSPPETCSNRDPTIVTVGWSYVQLEEQLAIKLGFVAGAPIKLITEESRITVSLCTDDREILQEEKVVCPP
jgi:hypothetical protein